MFVEQARFEWLLLGGFRYADLRETLSIYNATSDFSTVPATSWSLTDNFNTRNQFYGGQLGTRWSFQHERFSVESSLKVALGVNHELVDIHGNLTQTGPTSLSLPYGFFTEPTNIGIRSANQFSVIPTADIRIGYQVTKCIRLSLGYDFMYWGQVVRPGNQIDRNINLSQNAASFGAGGTLVGAAGPQPLFNRSDFTAHGVTFGLEISY